MAGGPSEDVPKSEMIRQRRVPVWDVPKKGGSHTGMSVPFWDVPDKSKQIDEHGPSIGFTCISSCGMNRPYKVYFCSIHEKTCFQLS